LIELYAREKKLDKVANLYKKLYKMDPQKYFLQKIIEISLYRNDIDGVISFLEHNRGNEEILFTFYKEKKKFQKAIDTAQKLYQKTQDAKWLAEEGMLVYEKAKRSRAVDPHSLKRMQELLEAALKKGLKNALYLNYYGYTLIDHDLDIDRGVTLVKQALAEDPKNTYYLDSLAWGLYKKGSCDKAYEIMKGVVAEEGLQEEEIRTHWDLIRKCTIKKQ
jgi:tetratricopeptide (TPR) repeat protein